MIQTSIYECPFSAKCMSRSNENVGADTWGLAACSCNNNKKNNKKKLSNNKFTCVYI